MSPPEGLSDAQAAVYDRQLRLWGHEVQRRLTDAKVLILGGDGLAAEIAKNLVLAGVGHVALADSTPVAQASFGNFLVPADAGDAKTVAQACTQTLSAMNPLITVTEASVPTPSSPSQPWDVQRQHVEPYDVVISTYGATHAMSDKLEAACADAGKILFLAEVIGSLSYVFVNLGAKYTYMEKQQAQGEAAGKGGSAGQMRELAYGRLDASLSRPVSKCLGRRPIHPLYQVLRAVRQYETQHHTLVAESDLQGLHAAAAALETSEGVAEGTVSRPLLEAWVCERGAAGQLAAAPVCAVSGGVVANCAVRAISRVGAPLKNWFFFSLHDGVGMVEDITSA